jgi:hypothetical protein
MRTLFTFSWEPARTIEHVWLRQCSCKGTICNVSLMILDLLLTKIWSHWSGVEFATDGQSASLSWCLAVLWGPWPDFTCSLVGHVPASSCRAPSLTRRRMNILRRTPLIGQSREGPVTIYYCLIWDALNRRAWSPHPYPRNRVVQFSPGRSVSVGWELISQRSVILLQFNVK